MRELFRRVKSAIFVVIMALSLPASPLFAAPSGAIAAYSAAQSALQKEDYYGAAEKYKEALVINARYTDALLGLARVYFYLGEYRETINALDSYVKFDSSNEAQSLRARALSGLGRAAEAKTLFNDVLKREPNNLDAQFGLAEVALLEGRTERSVDMLKRLVKLIPDNRRALLSLTMLLDDRGDYKGAGAYMEQALHYFPSDPLTLYFAGNHYRFVKNYAAALASYRAAQSIGSTMPDLAKKEAATLLALGRYDDAERVLRDLVAGRGREDASVWDLLATTFKRSGDTDNALRCYTEALLLEPNNETYRLEAENLVTSSYPVDSTAGLSYAQTRLAEGRKQEASYDYARAMREYRRAVQLAPDSVDARFAYASLLAKMGAHFSSIDSLKLIESEGRATPRISDMLESEVARDVESVAAEWGLKGGPTGVPIRLAVYGQSNVDDDAADKNALWRSNFVNYMGAKTRIEAMDGGVGATAGEAWRKARASRVDFYITFSAGERNRQFYAGYSLYAAATGAKISERRVTRASANKIDESTALLVNRLDADIPVRAKIIRRRGDSAVITLGAMNGVTSKEKFIVIKSGGARFVGSAPYFEYGSGDELGAFTVTKTDEYVSEGLLSGKVDPDIIAQEDEVFLVRNATVTPQIAPLFSGLPEGFFLIH